MNKFIGRMLELGVEFDKAVSPIEISVVINDAEILYKTHIEQLTIPFVVGQSEQLPNVQCTVCGRIQEQMLKYKCTSSACPH
jgi:hypothetical protein